MAMAFKDLINSCEAASPYRMPSRKEIEEIGKKNATSPAVSRPTPLMHLANLGPRNKGK
jgi:hypothetical protein